MTNFGKAYGRQQRIQHSPYLERVVKTFSFVKWGLCQIRRGDRIIGLL